MTKNLDMRGYSCPIPLLRTRDALVSCDELTVLVDDPAARENICKFSVSQGFLTTINENDGEWAIHIAKNHR